MLQVLEHQAIYIVDLDVLPRQTIVGVGVEQYYAAALTTALAQGLITKPGKYGIWIDFNDPNLPWKIFEVMEDPPAPPTQEEIIRDLFRM